MTTTTILNKYDKALHRVLHRFIIKQFLEDDHCTSEFNGWVGDIVGGIAYFDDIAIRFDDIVYDLRTNQPKGKIIEWMDANVENEQYINYHSYCLGLRIEKLPKEKTIIEKIQQWVIDRNLQTQDPRVQMCKTVEELGELANAINKNNKEGMIDGIGDTVVTLICISQQLGLDFNECLEYAYNEIKDRKGKLINGTFVKEADL